MKLHGPGWTVSQDSGVAPFETLFHDFNFEALSFFNYWTSDEGTNDRLELENRDINDMPRFVKLVWNIAPDLERERKDQEKLNPPSLVRISDGVGDAERQFVVDGVTFSPDQIQPKNFTQLADSLANSDIAAGVIQTVVTLPLVPAGIVNSPSPFRIDLDQWFSTNMSDGVIINQLRNHYDNYTNGYFGLQHVIAGGVSSNITAMSSEMFDGQFTVSPSSYISPGIQISAVNPSFPALSIDAETAQAQRLLSNTPAEDIFDQITYDHTTQNPSNSVNVSLVDTGIGAVVDSSRVNVAVDPAHVNSIAATAQVLKYLISYSESGLSSVQRKISVKSFSSPNGLPSKEYVGYLIEKYEQINGVFVMKELIGLGDVYADHYYDTKVRYGGVYRYRIRSILRWTRPKNVTAEGTDNSSVGDLLTQDSSNANTSNMSLTPNYASYFGSEWSKKWGVAHVIDDQPAVPPDQLEVRPQSNKKRIVVTFQIPENPQRDIYKMTLWRRIVDRNGRDVEPWTSQANFDMTSPGYYEDYNVDFIPKIGNERSPGPMRYVYAVTSTSVHNGESVMSEQLGGRLNAEWQQKGEFTVEFYSSRGVNRTYDHGIFSVIPIKKYKTHIVVVPNNSFDNRDPAEIQISGQERLGIRMLNGNDYILRIHSLDTGETHDVDFSTEMVSLEPRRIQAPTDVYIPSANEQYFYDDQALTSG